MIQLESLRKKASASLVFNSDIPEKYNKMAIKIDKRLFVFAYYNPKEWQTYSNTQTAFILGVSNLYGLLFDCGSVIKSLCSGEIIPRTEKRDIEKYEDIASELASIRIVLFHNISPELGKKNISHLKTYQNWIADSLRAIGKQTPECETDWNYPLNKLLDKANELNMIISKLISRTGNLSWIEKNEIVNNWIERGILFWYKKENGPLYEYIKTAYIWRYNFDFGMEPKRIYKSEINNWIENYMNSIGEMCGCDALQDFQKTLKNNMLSEANTWDKNCPILPADFLWAQLASLRKSELRNNI